nr:3'-5' exonuclease [Rhizobium sp. SSA_523]
MLAEVFDLLQPVIGASSELAAAKGDRKSAGQEGPGKQESQERLRELAHTFETLRQEGSSPLPVLQSVSNRYAVYDFELLSRPSTEKISDAPLDSLTYVVFDTETTGLLPDQGDEIVQIAAVRIVNGKRVRGEVFDSLVHPGRSIPASSTAVHGISNAMVEHAPGVVDVLERFRQFAQGAVLVAHNAPFDMEFLRRRERELHGRFDNPILDTVLLSAAVFGQAETHTLDALAERLGISISQGERHTAIGDATATAEIFLRLKDMLVARGVERFGAVLRETRKHKRLLRDLN